MFNPDIPISAIVERLSRLELAATILCAGFNANPSLVGGYSEIERAKMAIEQAVFIFKESEKENKS